MQKLHLPCSSKNRGGGTILFVILVLFMIPFSFAYAETWTAIPSNFTQTYSSADDGDTLFLLDGIYPNKLIKKDLTIIGSGNNTILERQWQLNGNISIENLKSLNSTKNGFQIRSNDNYSFNNIIFENAEKHGILTEIPNPNTANITMTNIVFSNTGLKNTDDRNADIQLNNFEGTIRIENVTITKALSDLPNTPRDNAYAIEFKGNDCSNDSESKINSAILKNITISGYPNKAGIFIQCYSDIENIQFENVNLANVTADIQQSEPSSLLLTKIYNSTLHLGDTRLNDIFMDCENCSVNATDADFGELDDFEIERNIVHKVDDPELGMVTWKTGQFFLNENMDIQNAINVASSGDIVNFAPGIYPIENAIILDKSLSLIGAQSDIDPRPSFDSNRISQSNNESIIDGQEISQNLMQLDADNIIINGFEFMRGFGDLVFSDSNPNALQNPQFSYNIVHSSETDEGIQLRSVDNAIISNNYVFQTQGDGINAAFSQNTLIDSNELHDISSSNAAIYLYNDGTRDYLNATISNNLVYDICCNDGIKLGDSDESLHGGNIIGNELRNIRQDGITVRASNVLVSENIITNSASENGAIYIDDSPHNITISNNEITNNGIFLNGTNPIDDPNTTYAIRINKGNDNSTGIVIYNNIIMKNEGGLINHPNNFVNATHNFWGHSTGPKTVQNDAKGQEISGQNVSFEPWFMTKSLGMHSNQAEEETLTQDIGEIEFDSSTNSTEVLGQAELPEDIVEIILTDNSEINLENNMTVETDNIITIGGQNQTLNNFSKNSLMNEDLTEETKIGNSDILVKKALQLNSGIESEPVKIKNNNLPSVVVEIPDKTTIMGSENWQGEILPPKKISKQGIAPQGFELGDNAIKVGSSDSVLLFDNAVTLVLENLTGTVGYQPTGSEEWIEISNQCSGTYENPDDPVFPSECYISNGIDTKIVTFHFTSFGELIKDPPEETISAPSTSKSSSKGGSGPTGGTISMSKIKLWASDDQTFRQSVFHLIREGTIDADLPTSNGKVSEWILDVGKFWKENRISDEEFFNAVQYFLDKKILE